MPRPGKILQGVDRENVPHRIFPQGQEQIAVSLYALKMPFQKQPPLAVFFNGEGCR
jgi:phage terminase large subunit-like protein